MSDLKALFSDLIRCETELWNAVDERLRSEHDLPLSWFEPMQVMSARTACRVVDIKEGLSITVGGASKLVDRIEASGLCRRRANPTDRRSQIVELTPAGRRMLANATKSFEDELHTRLGAVVSEKELDQLGTTLRTLRASNRRPAQRLQPHSLA
ncbi:MAG: MarR family transcriptional regulator, organic hydroperoxide resistance regulator [Actinomycetota bacterium]|jgi:DNA-binding MarR family transcriptional regulator